MTKIKSHLEATGITQAALAMQIGVSTAYMSQIANGARVPGLRVALDIERATGGAVPVASWSQTQEGAKA